MKTDYLIEAKKLIENNFSPVNSLIDDNEYTVKKTLSDIHKDVTNILPSRWIYESDIYEILSELGFKSFLYTFKPVYGKKGEEIIPERTLLVYLLDKKTAAI